MNAVAGDRDLCLFRRFIAKGLVLVRTYDFNRCAVLCGYVCNSASFGPDLFPSPFLKDDMEKRVYLHPYPLSDLLRF